MEDAKIIELFFQRDEQAVKETDTAYGRKLYNVYSISYDVDSKMWKVEFGISWDSYYYEVVYINNNGMTQLVATRPYPEAGEDLLPKPSEYT